MICGFDGANTLSDVELIDLDNPDGSCSDSIADYPIYIQYPTLMYHDGVISACGGIPDYNVCYDYDISSRNWTRVNDLSEDRYFPTSSVVGSRQDWLISGGLNNAAGSATTEIRANGVSTPGPTLNEGVFYSCQLTLNETHVFYTDGYDALWTSILDYEQGIFHDQVR